MIQLISGTTAAAAGADPVALPLRNVQPASVSNSRAMRSISSLSAAAAISGVTPRAGTADIENTRGPRLSRPYDALAPSAMRLPAVPWPCTSARSSRAPLYPSSTDASTVSANASRLASSSCPV